MNLINWRLDGTSKCVLTPTNCSRFAADQRFFSLHNKHLLHSFCRANQEQKKFASKSATVRKPLDVSQSLVAALRFSLFLCFSSMRNRFNIMKNPWYQQWTYRWMSNIVTNKCEYIWCSVDARLSHRTEKRADKLIKNAQNRKANEANVMIILSKFMGDNRFIAFEILFDVNKTHKTVEVQCYENNSLIVWQIRHVNA